ncbi:jg5039 [Pararge aegeria aegeria]|uniref:Jg5039 protein n=1 Tax=Pararge aegeria aegeria TaxID=348720 RepID=A0A8S4SBS4_9NEOP|nr:jg5039 [Pararge aegeria aegeria]
MSSSVVGELQKTYACSVSARQRAVLAPSPFAAWVRGRGIERGNRRDPCSVGAAPSRATNEPNGLALIPKPHKLVILYKCHQPPALLAFGTRVLLQANQCFDKMVYNFKVFKKCSPNGKITLYMPKRDFVDHISYVEPIDGIVVVDEEYVSDRRVFAQVVCTFRYGREEDEVMGLSFYKELYLASEQVYPPLQKRPTDLSRTQERLLKKLGENALPFRLSLPAGSPGSVSLQPGLEDEGEPCGVHYYVKLFVGETEIDRTHRRSTVALGIRKVQFAPDKPGPQPCTVVRKDFVLSPGQLELELTLDKQLYIHGETVAVNISIRNHSNKVVKKIKASILQTVDVVLFQNGQYRNVVTGVETQLVHI